mgnify:CR=1 FL=1
MRFARFQRANNMTKKPYLYLITSTSGHVKIGYSNDPVRRLAELRKTQGPYHYELEYLWEFYEEKQARYIEGVVHKMFKDRRVNGEWFILTVGDLLELGSYQFNGMVK